MHERRAAAPEAVIFDLDGVLIDSEPAWNAAKEALVRETGGCWRDEAPRVMMGMSSPEWTAYLRDELGVPMDIDAISSDVVRRMMDGYRSELPLLPGAEKAVRALAARWPLGLASSSNREVIDQVLELSGFGDCFRVAVSSEEVERGKPAPDVYLAVASALGADPTRCIAAEDSSNGLRAAAAARMTVIALPNPHYPPSADALSLAAITVDAVGEITPDLVERALIASPAASYAGPMTRLADEHCREYPPGTPPLSQDEAAELRKQVPAWELDGNRALRREFAFDDFNGAFGLVARVALLAESESHHPEIELEWGRAAFRTWTHTARGLSRNDFILAAKIDLLAES